MTSDAPKVRRRVFQPCQLIPEPNALPAPPQGRDSHTLPERHTDQDSNFHGYFTLGERYPSAGIPSLCRILVTPPTRDSQSTEAQHESQ